MTKNNTISTLNKCIQKKSLIIKDLKDQINTLNDKVESMQSYYDNYAIIIQYTNMKKSLIAIDRMSSPFKILTNPFYRNIVMTTFSMTQKEMLDIFINLREQRNNLCH